MFSHLYLSFRESHVRFSHKTFQNWRQDTFLPPLSHLLTATTALTRLRLSGLLLHGNPVSLGIFSKSA